jgi:hypothetical protein
MSNLHERALEYAFTQAHCRTREDAQRFIAYAVRCVRDTPVGGGQTPVSLVTCPVLCDAFQRIEDYVHSGEWPDWETAAKWLEQSRKAAHSVVPFRTNLTGNEAACWAIPQLAEAVEELTRAETAASEVAGNANLAAMLARRASGNPPAAEAVEFQGELFGEMFG